jgi:hypothetical protein
MVLFFLLLLFSFTEGLEDNFLEPRFFPLEPSMMLWQVWQKEIFLYHPPTTESYNQSMYGLRRPPSWAFSPRLYIRLTNSPPFFKKKKSLMHYFRGCQFNPKLIVLSLSDRSWFFFLTKSNSDYWVKFKNKSWVLDRVVLNQWSLYI